MSAGLLPKSSWSIGRSGIEVAKRKGIYKGRQKGTTKADPTRARELWDKGLTTAEIAQALATNKRTVQRYLKADALAKNSRVFLK